MADQAHNNVLKRHFQASEHFDDEFLADDALPVCLKCLKPCHPLQHYCDNCDSNDVINPLASYMPFVRLRFACGFFGKLWRITWYNDQPAMALKLTCLLVIILFAPILLIVGLPLFLIGKIPKPKLQAITVAAFYIIAFLLSVMFIYLNVFRGALSPVPFS